MTYVTQFGSLYLYIVQTNTLFNSSVFTIIETRNCKGTTYFEQTRGDNFKNQFKTIYDLKQGTIIIDQKRTHKHIYILDAQGPC